MIYLAFTNYNLIIIENGISFTGITLHAAQKRALKEVLLTSLMRTNSRRVKIEGVLFENLVYNSNIIYIPSKSNTFCWTFPYVFLSKKKNRNAVKRPHVFTIAILLY